MTTAGSTHVLRRRPTRRRVTASIGLAAALVATFLVTTPRPATAAAPVVTSYSHLSITTPQSLTAGPDGALWFTTSSGLSIMRMTTAGVATSGANPGGFATDIAFGPDGALYAPVLSAVVFVNDLPFFVPAVQKFTTSGQPIGLFYGGIDQPGSIAAGSDGAMWFTDLGSNSIWRVTTGGDLTNYTHPSINVPIQITAGPDGALWFVNSGSQSIGRISTAGVVTNYKPPSVTNPSSITAGPDGALWFTNGLNTIARMTTGGVVTNYTHASISFPTSIAAGADGALWFTNHVNDSIGRITTAGQVTNYVHPSIDGPGSIAAGPDGAMWFANTSTNTIGRITSPSGGAPAIVTIGLHSAPVGQPYSLALAGQGGTPPYTWKKVGKLPKGLKLNATTGVLSGTPKSAGAYPFQVRLEDKARPKQTVTKSFIFAVTAAPLTITTANIPGGTAKQAYSAPLSVTGGSPPYKWKKVAPLPKGLRLNAKSGRISGVPKVAGAYAVSVRVTDLSTPKKTTTKVFNLFVAP